jgi:phosphoglycolate phosphatase
MHAALEAIVADGARLILCTSKARVFAERVVEHFGFAPLLSGVYGAELDGRFDDKGDLIEHLLAAEDLAPEQARMVGDRSHDVLAAARHGIPTVGVLWGYGSREELTLAGASVIISAPCELIDIVKGASRMTLQIGAAR